MHLIYNLLWRGQFKKNDLGKIRNKIDSRFISVLGVLLAILEHLCYIMPVYNSTGKVENLTAGTVAAGYQNFLICIEMFFAAIALKYAFPISVYVGEGSVNAEGRSVTMQSISSSLKVSY